LHLCTTYKQDGQHLQYCTLAIKCLSLSRRSSGVRLIIFIHCIQYKYRLLITRPIWSYFVGKNGDEKSRDIVLLSFIRAQPIVSLATLRKRSQ
jgi:hypothetical protein